jgi:hypothetical protein
VRARVAWSLTLPVLIVGELAGHSLAYRIVAPDPHERAALLARTGHHYLGAIHPVIALCLAFAGAAVAARVAAGFGGRAPRRIPSWRFAALPSVAFVLQEYAERLAHSGHLRWTTLAEPPVLVGIVLQIPCGLLALWLVRTLLRVAHSAGRALSHVPSSLPVRLEAVLASPAPTEPLGLVPLARGSAERGPPPFFE